MSETTFENAQAGDNVWSTKHGWGTITCIQNSYDCPLLVKFNENLTLAYSMFGREDSVDNNQTLYWGELKIPERPKHKVKKVIEGWINIYAGSGCSWNLYKTEEIANNEAHPNRLGKALFIRHKYEVEE